MPEFLNGILEAVRDGSAGKFMLAFGAMLGGAGTTSWLIVWFAKKVAPEWMAEAKATREAFENALALQVEKCEAADQRRMEVFHRVQEEIRAACEKRLDEQHLQHRQDYQEREKQYRKDQFRMWNRVEANNDRHIEELQKIGESIVKFGEHTTHLITEGCGRPPHEH